MSQVILGLGVFRTQLAQDILCYLLYEHVVKFSLFKQGHDNVTHMLAFLRDLAAEARRDPFGLLTDSFADLIDSIIRDFHTAVALFNAGEYYESGLEFANVFWAMFSIAATYKGLSAGVSKLSPRVAKLVGRETVEEIGEQAARESMALKGADELETPKAVEAKGTEEIPKLEAKNAETPDALDFDASSALQPELRSSPSIVQHIKRNLLTAKTAKELSAETVAHMLASGEVVAKGGKLTQAGRAYQKHMDRIPTTYPASKGAKRFSMKQGKRR